jgi:hypothetical protein
VFGYVERFTSLKEFRPQISIVLHDKHLLFSWMSPVPWTFQWSWSALWCKRELLIVIFVTLCFQIRHEFMHFLTHSFKNQLYWKKTSVINYHTTLVPIHESYSTDVFLVFTIFKLKVKGPKIKYLFVSVLIRILCYLYGAFSYNVCISQPTLLIK